MKLLKPILGLVVLLVGIFSVHRVIWAASVDPTNPTYRAYPDIRGLYAITDSGYATGGIKSVAAPGDTLSGSQNRFGWKQLNPAPGQYNWQVIDDWLAKLQRAGKKGAIGVMLRCEDIGGQDACAPDFALENNPITINRADVPSSCGFNSNDPRLKRLNFLANQESAIKNFVQAFGEKYRNNSTVAWIEVDVGYWGEANPHAGSSTICDKQAQLKAYQAAYSSSEWVNYANRLVELYVSAFNNQKQLSVVTTGALHSQQERIERINYLVQLFNQGKKVGIHHSGLEADFPVGSKIGDNRAQYLPQTDTRAYAAHWSPLERLGQKMFVSFEWNHWNPRGHYNLPLQPEDEAHVWWSVLNALDKHADALLVFSPNMNASDSTWNTANPIWNWKNQAAWSWFKRFASRTPAEAPEAWIAFRTSMFSAPDSGENAQFYFGDLFDYEYFIEHNLAASGNSQIGHYAAEKNNGGANLPWDTNKSDWRGAYNRQTDLVHGRPYLHLKVADQFASGSVNNAQIKVTYWDGNSSMTGNQWALEYDSGNGQVSRSELVSLGGSGQWKEKTFNLSNLSLNNSINGSDFRLTAIKGDTYFNMLRLIIPNRSGGNCGNADLDGDGKVDLNDYSLLVNNWFGRQNNSTGDLNCDQQIDLEDYALLINQISF